ncbi:unnamed protein product, partial [Didymodactylos carnosus]|jgi:hypothetical protein
MDLS